MEKNQLVFEVQYIDPRIYVFTGPGGSGKTRLGKLIRNSCVIDFGKTTRDFINFMISTNPEPSKEDDKFTFIICFNSQERMNNFCPKIVESLNKARVYFRDNHAVVGDKEIDIYDLHRMGFRL